METNESTVFEEVAQYYQPASAGRRFVNYLIDLIMYYISFMVCAFLGGAIMALCIGTPGAFADFLQTSEGYLLMYLFAIAFLVIFHTLVEGLTKGRSLGKLITGTVAIQEDGGQITWKDALMRSLCRLIPFEPFSALGGRPWHDTITKTLVTRK